MPQRHPRHARKEGFTLIELAIVMVIIGLLVGAIFVGRDLIRAAEIRSTVSQLEKYKAAVGTFRTKYNGLPGDFNSRDAAQVAFTARPGTIARGDGNGLIENQDSGGCGSGCDNLNGVGGEEICFWDDLSHAKLIDFTQGPFHCFDAMTMPIEFGPDVNLNSNVMVPDTFPKAKIGGGNIWEVYSSGGLNYFLLAMLDADILAQGVENSIAPQQAYAIDIKLDDGLPLTGSVIAVAGPTVGICPLPCTTFSDIGIAAVPAAPAAGVCVSNAAGNPYNLQPAYADTSACQVRFSF